MDTRIIVRVVGARPPLANVPPSEGAKRRQALVRNAAPVGSPCGKARPFSGRELPAHNAGRRAYRRFTAAFFLRPQDRLLKTEGAAIAKLPYSAGFFAPAFIRSTSPLPDGPT